MALEPDTLVVPLARTEVVAHEPWLVGTFSQHGAGHVRKGLPNGDAYAIGRADEHVLIAVADGVSSAPLSTYGAHLAVTTAVERMTSHARMATPQGQKSLKAVVNFVRSTMDVAARQLDRPVSDLATTLLVAMLTPTSATVAKIGDGSVMAVEADRTGARLVPMVDTPHVGDGVVDLTHKDWQKHLRGRHIPDLEAAGIATLVLGTDGAAGYLMAASKAPTATGERTALSTLYVHDNLGEALAKRTSPDLIGYFAQLLFLPSLKDPFDDRTLVIATTRPARRPA